MTEQRLSLGRKAERICRRRLRWAGWKIVDSNWRTSFGELDLVAIEGTTLVFVEVKSASERSGARRAGPARPVLAVGPEKQERLVRLAGAWIAAEESRGGLPRALENVRFDVVGIVFSETGRVAEWEHLRDAFRPAASGFEP